MKKVIKMFLVILMSVPFTAFAPPTIPETEAQIIKKYEFQMFTERQRFVENSLRPISSDYVFDYIMASPFVVDQEVSKRLFEIAEELKADPVDLITVMYAESALKTTAVNDLSDATGLIQWLPSSAKRQGLTKEKLLRMSIIEQLNEVEKYYKGTNKLPKIKGFMDLYLAVFRPRAVGKGEDYVIGRKGGLIYRQQPYVDMNKDGKITSGDLADFGKSRLNI